MTEFVLKKKKIGEAKCSGGIEAVNKLRLYILIIAAESQTVAADDVRQRILKLQAVFFAVARTGSGCAENLAG